MREYISFDNDEEDAVLLFVDGEETRKAVYEEWEGMWPLMSVLYRQMGLEDGSRRKAYQLAANGAEHVLTMADVAKYKEVMTATGNILDADYDIELDNMQPLFDALGEQADLAKEMIARLTACSVALN